MLLHDVSQHKHPENTGQSAGTCCIIMTFASASTVPFFYLGSNRTSHHLYLKQIKRFLNFFSEVSDSRCLFVVPVLDWTFFFHSCKGESNLNQQTALPRGFFFVSRRLFLLFQTSISGEEFVESTTSKQGCHSCQGDITPRFVIK